METRSWWVFVAENIYFRQFFRAVSVVNLIVLVLSIPFYNLNQLEGNQEFIVSTQFQVITVLDFILSCIYTFNFVLRIIYNRKITKRNDKVCNCIYKIVVIAKSIVLISEAFIT